MNGAGVNTDSDDDLHDALSHFSSTARFGNSLSISDDEVSPINEPATVSNRLPLIPSDCNDVYEAIENFVRVFEARYGEVHPFFTPVSLAELVNDMQTTHHSIRKPALLYIHDDKSVMTQVFCSQVLCSPAMIDFINSNFTLWPWDFTLTENRAKLIEWIELFVGHQKSFKISQCAADEFPLLVIIYKTNGSLDLDIIKGGFTLEGVMSLLMSASDQFHEQVQQEAVDEAARLAREKVRNEQNAAFQESLAADKLKSQLKLQEEQEKHHERQRQLNLEETKERQRKLIEERLQPEPDEQCGQPITRLRIKTHNGSNIERRFSVQQPLSHLFDFLASKNLHTDDFKVYTGFPKRELTALNTKTTFADLNFGPREVIVVEAR